MVDLRVCQPPCKHKTALCEHELTGFKVKIGELEWRFKLPSFFRHKSSNRYRSHINFCWFLKNYAGCRIRKGHQLWRNSAIVQYGIKKLSYFTTYLLECTLIQCVYCVYCAELATHSHLAVFVSLVDFISFFWGGRILFYSWISWNVLKFHTVWKVELTLKAFLYPQEFLTSSADTFASQQKAATAVLTYFSL